MKCSGGIGRRGGGSRGGGEIGGGGSVTCTQCLHSHGPGSPGIAGLGVLSASGEETATETKATQ